MNVDMSFALQDKKKLMKEVKLKNQFLEKHGLLERSKRPRVKGSDTTSRQVEELQAKHQEIENLWLDKKELEAKHCEEVKILKKKLREKDVRLTQVTKELATIKTQVANKDKGPTEEAEVGNIDS